MAANPWNSRGRHRKTPGSCGIRNTTSVIAGPNGISIAEGCRLMGLPRSTYYDAPALDRSGNATQSSAKIRVSWTRCHLGCGMRPCLHRLSARWGEAVSGLPAIFVGLVSGIRSARAKRKARKVDGNFEACKLRFRFGGSPSLTAPFPEPRACRRFGH
jgi:hypothetical protein